MGDKMKIQDFINALNQNISPKFVDKCPLTVNGAYDYIRDTIFVHPQSTYDSFCVFFHELAHSTGHYSRLNREIFSCQPWAVTTEQYNEEETIAQLACDVLLDHFGLNNEARRLFTSTYVFNYGLTELEVARLKANEVPMIVDFILNQMFDLNKLEELTKVA